MNAAATTPAAPRPSASTAWAESFVPEAGGTSDARAAADRMGVVSVSPGAASVLGFLAAVVQARAVVEIGTGTGVSGLALLGGMAADGVLTSIDTESEHQAAAREVFTHAGYPARQARLIAGSALQVLPKLSDAAYDLVLVDGDPLEYVEYVEQALRLLRPGGLLVVNHALAGGRIADESNEDDDVVILREALAAISASGELAPVVLPVGDGLLVARRS